MKAILFALICVCAFAEDDLYNEFLHGKTVLNRMKTIRSFNKRNEKILVGLEKSERKILNYLEILYNDMGVAVGQSDRLKIENQISKMQRSLESIRKQKNMVIRKMRKMADKIALPERDRLVRKGRLEQRVGLEQNLHIRREVEENQKKLLEETKTLAHKYATMAAEIAAAKMEKKINEKNKGDILKAQTEYKEFAQKSYAKWYKKIVKAIEEATAEGVSNEEIKIVCRNAIDGLIRRLEHERMIYIVSKDGAKDIEKIVGKSMQASVQTLSKNFDKTINKDATSKKTETKDLKAAEKPKTDAKAAAAAKPKTEEKPKTDAKAAAATKPKAEEKPKAK